MDGVVAFLPRECSLICNQKSKDTGKKVDKGFTALEMVSFRWNKLVDAGKTNMTHVLRWWLNPACIGEDLSSDDQIELARRGLWHFFPNNPRMVSKI